MNKSSRVLVIALCLLLGTVAGYAQQKRDSEQTIRIETTLVSVPVIVSDRQGRYVGGLKASDFTLYEDRTKRSIDFFADVEEPINVALLLDTSKSTMPVLDDIKKAAKDFVKQLRPQDRAMIVTFDFEERALCELTSDRKTLERAIGKARIGEQFGTKLRDAVYDVMKEEFKNVKGRKAIILLTDGKDHGSQTTVRTLLESATEADTLIYSVFYLSRPAAMMRNQRGPRGGWGIPGGRRPGGFPRFALPFTDQFPGGGKPRQRGAGRIGDDVAIEFLQRLSDLSAGRYFDSEIDNLKKTFEQIVEELRHQYRLGFYPPDHPTDSIHNIKVEVARPDVAVRSRRLYRVSAK